MVYNSCRDSLNCSYSFFADDVALLATTPYGLQNQLNSLKACCDRLHMEVNRIKQKLWCSEKAATCQNMKNVL